MPEPNCHGASGARALSPTLGGFTDAFRCLPFNNLARLRRIRGGAPVQLIHGTLDEVVAIEAARANDWETLEVRPEVQAAYVAEVQQALEGTAYTGADCHSYYLDDNGRNSFSWPWPTAEFGRRLRFRPVEYTVTYAPDALQAPSTATSWEAHA